jgi:hypothetical protein
VQTQKSQQQPLPSEVDVMFDYSSTMVEAEMKWIEKFIRQLEESASILI